MTQEFLKNKKNIIAWLDKYNVENYTLLPDEQYGYSVNVAGGVNLARKQLENIPVKFNYIQGDLVSYQNQLTSLEFCPEIVGGSFYCSGNRLTSLRYCPKNVGGSFYCQYNQITSLEYCPERVGVGFYCNRNRISSLEFCPQEVGEGFYCHDNDLLGSAQNITNFSEIYEIHKHVLSINKEKEILRTHITEEGFVENKKQSKPLKV